MSNLVKYGSFDIDQAKTEKEALDAEGGDFLKLNEGKTTLRFLPPPIGRRSPFLVVHQHYIKIPGQQNAVSFNCPRMDAKKPCPVCKKADELRATGNPADRDKAWELTAKRRVYANVINRANPDAGPKVLAFGKQVHDALLAIRADEDNGGDFTNPTKNGFDIIVDREGTGKNDTKYRVTAARNNSPLAPDEEQAVEWIEMQANLDKFATILTAEEILRQLGGEGASSGGGRSRRQDDDEAPARGRGRTAQDDIEAEFSEVPFK